MNYTYENNKIIVTEMDSFEIDEILECGQCFRFEKIDNKHYYIIAHNRVLYIKQNETSIEFYPCNTDDFENIWLNYFDLNRDYSMIKNKLIIDDTVLNDAVSYAPGIRLLRQDPFETLISFIISQNNRITQIKKVIQNISERFGERIGDTQFYSFPTKEQLLKADVESLMECRAGFRAKYIIDAVEKVNLGSIIIDANTQLSAEELKQNLMTIKGVGTKVSDCVLLFAYAKYSNFPTDVWVKRIMQHFYFNDTEISVEEIHKFASNKFGEYAGFAQQYLFHHLRMTNPF